MNVFLTIESWATSIGYLVEKDDHGYIWYREHDLEPRRCSTVGDVMREILEDLKNSYKGSE